MSFTSLVPVRCWRGGQFTIVRGIHSENACYNVLYFTLIIRRLVRVTCAVANIQLKLITQSKCDLS